jgi:hypothetical protein
VPAPENTKLAILVRGKDGKDAFRVEEAANLQKSKGDSFADRALPLAAGEYDVAAAILDGAGAVVSSARRPVTVTALPTEFAASTVFLAYNDLPADGAKPEDPFVLQNRKFVGRGSDNKMDGSDELAYVVRVYNPGVDATNHTILVKRTLRIKPKGGGPAIDVPTPPEQPQPAPTLKDGKDVVVVDLAGAIVDELKQYFKSGDYTLRVVLTDGVSGKTLEQSVPFSITGGAETGKKEAAPKKK